MSRGGRPTKYNEARADAIIALAAKGCSYRTQANGVGISTTTLMNWLRRGRDGEEPFATFVVRHREATAKAIGLVEGAAIERILEGDGALIRWWLSRKVPDEYGDTDKGEAAPTVVNVVLPSEVDRGDGTLDEEAAEALAYDDD